MEDGTRADTLVAEHTKTCVAEEWILEEERIFLRYLRGGLKAYLGRNQALTLDIIDTTHCFDADYPLGFTVRIAINYEKKIKEYYVQFRGVRKPGSENNYLVMFLKKEGPSEPFDIITDGTGDNYLVYAEIFKYFMKLFGEKGEVEFSIDEVPGAGN